MADNEFADIEDLVRRDVIAGLASKPTFDDSPPPFTPSTDRGDADDDGLLYANAINGGEFTAIEWAFQCAHTGTFAGIPRTGRDLTIYGVTIVRQRGDKTTFRRYVDWAAVMADLGVSASFRPAYESIDEIPNINVARRQVAKKRRPVSS